ncbi:hypothetical protein AVEN_231754-1 [Araneus ventricosus]|uniref:Uncharacterized protein n=1 Tax=Araneus ventricosus TaxID=182803 RepID=A0A4Y2SRV6_ARAVE|nr:hypothetical protein AVEN_231754-1 [Araneus ventricosus]
MLTEVDRGLKSRLPVAKTHLNVITDYARLWPVLYHITRLHDWVKAFRGGRIESADLHRTGRESIPQHQIDILIGILSIVRLWAGRELSVEVGLGLQTMWSILKKWRMLGRCIALINKQHLANGILLLSGIWQRV